MTLHVLASPTPMAKRCEDYAWTTREARVVPEGFVGGGREIVADEKCPSKP